MPECKSKVAKHSGSETRETNKGGTPPADSKSVQVIQMNASGDSALPNASNFKKPKEGDSIDTMRGVSCDNGE